MEDREALRNKLRNYREEKRTREILHSLTAFNCHGFLDAGTLPPALEEALQQIRRSDSVPDDHRAHDSASPSREEWIRDYFHQMRLESRFFVATGLEVAAWLDCEIKSESWIENLLSVFGPDLTILSRDRRLLIVIFDEEWEMEAFHATSK